MQIPADTDVAELFDRLVEDQPPGRVGRTTLLRAQATLIRRLDTDLAQRALISRSGMTRRVARLVDEGLVRRERAPGDRRGVVVALTDAGILRLAEAVPVHVRGISEPFVAKLD